MGKPLKGIVSLALVGAFGFSTYALASSGLYLNALFVTFPWLHKFYFGQIRLTKKLLDEKQQRRTQKKAAVCQKNVETLLKKYPISLR
jgi:TM2 domain-containing membrane protein YozV